MEMYKVRGLCTISFEMEVIAKNKEEAEEIGYNTRLLTGWEDNSVYIDGGTVKVYGEPRDVEAELIEVGSNMKAINIEWDVDCEEDLQNLPTEIDIPDWIEEDEYEGICDYITDVTGYCHIRHDLVKSVG